MAELADVTQALLGLREENDENTAETKQMRKEIFSLNKNISAFFLDQKRRMEGDGLEEDREKSDAKAGGGVDINKLLGGSGFRAAQIGLGGISAIVGIISGLVTEFLIRLSEAFEILKGTKIARGISLVVRYVTTQLSLKGGIVGKLFNFIRGIFEGIGRVFSNIKIGVTNIGKAIRFGFLNKGMVDLSSRLSKVFGAKSLSASFFQRFGAFLRSITTPFENALKLLQASGIKTAGGTIARIGQFFPTLGNIIKFFGTFFFTLGRTIFIPLNIIIGVFQGLTGLVSGFTKRMEEGGGFFSSLYAGAVEGFRRVVRTLLVAPLDLLLKVGAFILDKVLSIFGIGDGSAVGNFLKKFNLTKLFDMIMDLFAGVLDFDFTAPFFKIADAIGGVLAGISSGIMAGFGALIQFKNPFTAFKKAFTAGFENVGGTDIAGSLGQNANVSGGRNARNNRQALNENMEQQNLPNEQGGGVTLNDGSTVVNNQSDNSQAVSMSAEEPFDNQDQMEKYASGGRNRRRG